ncbi:MAG: hypothetical protein J7L95_06990 [Prolixibacteraceae bacterium]|nr:hypothetical protein [Prolixibacteraceae bacterium]
MKNKVFLLIVTLTITFSGFCSALSDFEKIKERVVKELMKTEVDDARIEKLVNTIRDDGTWPGINYKDVSRTGFEHRIHSSNMVALARAYKSKSSEFYKNKKVKSAIELALKN